MAESFIGLASLEPIDRHDVRVLVSVEIDDVTSPNWRGVVVHTQPADEFSGGDVAVVLVEGARRGFLSTATIGIGVVRTQLVLRGDTAFEAPTPPDLGRAGDPVTDELVAEVMRYHSFTESYARFHIAHVRGEITDEDPAQDLRTIAPADHSGA